MSTICLPFAATALALSALPLGAQARPADQLPGPTLTASRAAAGAPTITMRRPLRKTAPGNTVEQFMSPSSPLEVSAARKADRIAWVAYERGMRNVYVASAPDFKAV